MTTTFKVPTTVALILGLLAGAMQAVNEAVLSLSGQLHAGIAVLLVGVAALGISPIVGEQFRTGLHLPGWAYTVVSALLSIAVLAVATVHMSTPVHTVVATVVTILAALGFSPTVAAVE